MLNRYIGKNVELTVTFAGFTSCGGSAPVCYYGILKEVDEDYCLLSLNSKKIGDSLSSTLGKKPNLGETCSGDICIKKEHIVTCRELQ